KSIPVFDDGAYNDERGYHYQWFHFAVRERMTKQNGGAANHLLWRGPVQAEKAWSVFVDWVASKKRPAAAVEGWWIQNGEGGAAVFHQERQTFSRQPDSACNKALPSSGFTRLVAGGPLDASVVKCQLKPIDAKDYPASFTAADLQRLRSIFPGGVCNFAKPGVNQTRVVTWASVGPAPENLIIPAPSISNRSQPCNGFVSSRSSPRWSSRSPRSRSPADRSRCRRRRRSRAAARSTRCTSGRSVRRRCRGGSPISRSTKRTRRSTTSAPRTAG